MFERELFAPGDCQADAEEGGGPAGEGDAQGGVKWDGVGIGQVSPDDEVEYGVEANGQGVEHGHGKHAAFGFDPDVETVLQVGEGKDAEDPQDEHTQAHGGVERSGGHCADDVGNGDKQPDVKIGRLPGALHVERGFEQAQESQTIHEVGAKHGDDEAKKLFVRNAAAREAPDGEIGTQVLRGERVEQGVAQEGEQPDGMQSRQQHGQRDLSESLEAPFVGEGGRGEISQGGDQRRRPAAPAHRDEVGDQREHDWHADAEGERNACQPEQECGFTVHPCADQGQG